MLQFELGDLCVSLRSLRKQYSWRIFNAEIAEKIFNTDLIFDLKATDTYVQSGDQVFIEADAFVQVINPNNCVATNSHAVSARVAGGTGGYAGASGNARFQFVNNLTPCNGQNAPAHVWFEGVVMRP